MFCLASPQFSAKESSYGFPRLDIDCEITENELGLHIKLGRYDFYKDAYPEEDKISELRDKYATAINPFENLQFEVSGISPYCQIVVNNQNCSDVVQDYVKT